MFYTSTPYKSVVRDVCVVLECCGLDPLRQHLQEEHWRQCFTVMKFVSWITLNFEELLVKRACEVNMFLEVQRVSLDWASPNYIIPQVSDLGRGEVRMDCQTTETRFT